MPNYSRTLLALTGVIAGGMRRKATCIGAQALVSKMYPQHTSGSITIQPSVYSAGLVQLVRESSYTEGMSAGFALYNVGLISPLVVNNASESLNASMSMFGASIIPLVKSITPAAETINAAMSVHDVNLQVKALSPTLSAETLSANSAIYGVDLYVP
jgi:hypothetical protein